MAASFCRRSIDGQRNFRIAIPNSQGISDLAVRLSLLSQMRVIQNARTDEDLHFQKIAFKDSFKPIHKIIKGLIHNEAVIDDWSEVYDEKIDSFEEACEKEIERSPKPAPKSPRNTL